MNTKHKQMLAKEKRMPLNVEEFFFKKNVLDF